MKDANFVIEEFFRLIEPTGRRRSGSTAAAARRGGQARARRGSRSRRSTSARPSLTAASESSPLSTTSRRLVQYFTVKMLKDHDLGSFYK